MNHANIAKYEASKTARKLAEDTFDRQEQAEQRRQLKTILDWLESADQRNDQDRYTGIRTECKDSGQWLMKDLKVKSWFEEAATDIIQTLRDGGVDPSAIDKLGRTAYHLAAKLKSYDIMRMLMPIGAALGFRDKTGRTTLQIALFNGCEDIVEMLLAGGELAHLPRDEREIAFHFAAGRANFFCMQKLLDNGTAINCLGPESMTALHLAIGKGRVDVVDYLLREGAGNDLTDFKGSNFLHVAVSSHNGRMVSRLPENGLDINAKSKKFGPPLALAVVLLEQYVVDVLLQSGGRVDIADSAGLTPLHIVAMEGNTYA